MLVAGCRQQTRQQRGQKKVMHRRPWPLTANQAEVEQGCQMCTSDKTISKMEEPCYELPCMRMVMTGKE